MGCFFKHLVFIALFCILTCTINASKNFLSDETTTQETLKSSPENETLQPERKPSITWTLVYPKVTGLKKTETAIKSLEKLANKLTEPKTPAPFAAVEIKAIEYSDSDEESVVLKEITHETGFPIPEISANRAVKTLNVDHLVDFLNNLEETSTHQTKLTQIVTIILDSETLIVQKDKCFKTDEYAILVYRNDKSIEALAETLEVLFSTSRTAIDLTQSSNFDFFRKEISQFVCFIPAYRAKTDGEISVNDIKLTSQTFMDKPLNDFRLTLYWFHPTFNVGLYTEYINTIINTPQIYDKLLTAIKSYLITTDIYFVRFSRVANTHLTEIVHYNSLVDNSSYTLKDILSTFSESAPLTAGWLEESYHLIEKHYKNILEKHDKSKETRHYFGILGLYDDALSYSDANWSEETREKYQNALLPYYNLDACLRISTDSMLSISHNPSLPCIDLNLNNLDSVQKFISALDSQFVGILKKLNTKAEREIGLLHISRKAFSKNTPSIDIYFVFPKDSCLKSMNRNDIHAFQYQLQSLPTYFQAFVQVDLQSGYGEYRSYKNLTYFLSSDDPSVVKKLSDELNYRLLSKTVCVKGDDAAVLEYIRVVNHPDHIGFRKDSQKYVVLFYDEINKKHGYSWLGGGMDYAIEMVAIRYMKAGYNLFVVNTVHNKNQLKREYSKLRRITDFNVIVYDKFEDDLRELVTSAIIQHVKKPSIVASHK